MIQRGISGQMTDNNWLLYCRLNKKTFSQDIQEAREVTLRCYLGINYLNTEITIFLLIEIIPRAPSDNIKYKSS